MIGHHVVGLRNPVKLRYLNKIFFIQISPPALAFPLVTRTSDTPTLRQPIDQQASPLSRTATISKPRCRVHLADGLESLGALCALGDVFARGKRGRQ